MAHHRPACSASFQLDNGQLCEATPAFLDFCDIPIRFIHDKPIWRVLLDGASCIWVPADVASSVKQTIRDIDSWLLGARRLGLRTSCQLVNAVFITPLGRVKVRSRMALRETTHSLYRLALYVSIFNTLLVSNNLPFLLKRQLICPLRDQLRSPSARNI